MYEVPVGADLPPSSVPVTSVWKSDLTQSSLEPLSLGLKGKKRKLTAGYGEKTFHSTCVPIATATAFP